MHCSMCGQAGHNQRKCTRIGMATAPASRGSGEGRG